VVPEQTATIADPAAIRADLEYMTARWPELGVPAVFEIRAFKEHSQPQVAKFSPDWIDDAVDWIENMNGLGFNIYAVRNPIRHDVSGSAKDSDIIGACFLWADCDDPAAAGNVYRFDGPKWSAAVTTGTVPSIRVHVYWQLETPITDMAEWRAMQQQIAAHFGSDSSVVNPSRIMRVGGTVAYPASHKLARGYVKELTTIRTKYDEERPPVTLEQMRRVFGSSTPAAPRTDAFQIDTGLAPAMDRERVAIQAMSGQEWNNAVLRLVGSYVRKGLSDGEIHALTDPLTLAGYTVDQTRTEVQDMITRTRANPKFEAEAQDQKTERAMAIALDVAPKVAPFKSWKPIDPLSLPPRDFIYGKHYIRKFASVTVAPGGLGKSTLVLAECIAIATGRPILGVVPKARERVVYFNAEDPEEEIDRRVLALCQHHGIEQSELVDWFYRASGRETELILAVGDAGDIVEPVFELIEAYARDIKPAVFAFDPLANMTESPETNDVFRRLGKRLSRFADAHNCSIEIVHHTRKLNGKEAEVEDSRGGGALIGAVRAGRVLNPMTADEAVKAGIETHVDHFRIEAAGKNNLSRPSTSATWLRRVSIELPNGDSVASVEAWEWPDAFDGVSADDARKVQIEIMHMDEPPRANPQSAAWVGHVVGRVLGMDTADKADKARINTMVKTWIKTGVLEQIEVRDTRNGRDVPAIIAGSNNPAAVQEGR
jgi:hypothetical protein